MEFQIPLIARIVVFILGLLGLWQTLSEMLYAADMFVEQETKKAYWAVVWMILGTIAGGALTAAAIFA